MNKVSLKWLKADEATRVGERPEKVPDGEIYQRALILEEDHFDATMFLNYGVLGFRGNTIEAPLGTNLYKENLVLGESTKEWLRTLMQSMGIDFVNAYSTSLFDATKRVMMVDKYGYRYASYGDPVIKPGMDEETVWRCRCFPAHWNSGLRGYNFWERESQPQADAIMTDLPGQTLCVYAADCVIGLISDPVSHAVGVFHSMWRNLVNSGLDHACTNSRSIIEELVKMMRAAYGCEPENLEVQLYPCASKETYEVDGDVARRFLENGLAEAVVEHERLCNGDHSGKFHLDLNAAVTMILEKLGVKPLNIRLMPFTTDDPEFPSKRNASKGRAGRRADIASHKVVELNPNAKPEPRTADALWNNNAQNVLIVRTK